MATSLLSDIQFGSFLIYSPRGTQEVSKRSKQICTGIKQDKNVTIKSTGVQTSIIAHLIKILREKVAGTPLDGFFTNETILVPAPQSALTKPNTTQPTVRICDELVRNGFGKESRFLLKRALAVPKAAFAKTPSERPTVKTHFDSMEVINEIEKPATIIVVDDVVTRGNMLLASVSKLKEVYPQSEVKGFALVRTLGFDEVGDIYDPRIGKISLKGENGSRSP